MRIFKSWLTCSGALSISGESTALRLIKLGVSLLERQLRRQVLEEAGVAAKR